MALLASCKNPYIQVAASSIHVGVLVSHGFYKWWRWDFPNREVYKAFCRELKATKNARRLRMYNRQQVARERKHGKKPPYYLRACYASLGQDEQKGVFRLDCQSHFREHQGKIGYLVYRNDRWHFRRATTKRQRIVKQTNLGESFSFTNNLEGLSIPFPLKKTLFSWSLTRDHFLKFRDICLRAEKKLKRLPRSKRP